MDNNKLAICLRRMLDLLPSWFAMRVEDSSTGAMFLNAIGIELDELAYLIEYAYQQMNLESENINELDIAYKVSVPIHLNINHLETVQSERTPLTRVYTIKDFMASGFKVNSHSLLHSHDVYFVDESKNFIYVTKPYDSFDDAKYGKITYTIAGESYTQALTLHHVWNSLDEIGLLLSCQRHEEETNKEYAARLKDVAQHPGGSNKTGFVNALARDLSIRKTITWLNGETPFIIQDAMVVLNSIEVDGVPCAIEELRLTPDQLVLIPGDEQYKDIERTVSYVHGLEMHQLHDKSDRKLQSELVNIDNTPTNLLKYYVERINIKSPIMWDHFRWDESFWDTSQPEQTGLGYLANVYDASISGFKNYR